MKKIIAFGAYVCLGFVLAVVFLFLVLGLWVTLMHHHIDTPEVAGWIQAIGSVGAIAGAIWVMNAQHRQTEIREERQKVEREDRVLRSIRVEVEVLLNGFQSTTGLTSVPEERPLYERYYYPQSAPFTIYESLAANIVDVRDDVRRRLIIETYSQAKGIIAILNMNNIYLRQREEARDSVGTRGVELRARIDRDLRSAAGQFWQRYSELLGNIEKIQSTFPV